MYNVTLRRVHETIVAKEKQEVSHMCVFVRVRAGGGAGRRRVLARV
jgi:hypothetical protein